MVVAGRRRAVEVAALKMERVQGHAGSGGLGGSAAAAGETQGVCRNLAAGFGGEEVDAGVEAHCSHPIGSHLLPHEDHKTAAA